MGTSTAGVASCVGERTRGGGARRQEGIPSELEGSLACLPREGEVEERPGTGRGPDEGEPSGYPEEDLAPHEESSEDHREGGRRP